MPGGSVSGDWLDEIRASRAVEKELDAKRKQRAAKEAAKQAPLIAEYVRRVVDAAPPLTAQQRDRLAELLSSNTESAE